jgi:hypothetical protein
VSAETDKEFEASLHRIADGEPAPNETPAFDPILQREHVADCKRGRKIEDFKQCLEKAGFAYFPADRLRPWENGMPKTQGEWRFRQGELRFAFLEDDICAWFSGPEELWRWIQNQINADKIKAANTPKRILAQVPR